MTNKTNKSNWKVKLNCLAKMQDIYFSNLAEMTQIV